MTKPILPSQEVSPPFRPQSRPQRPRPSSPPYREEEQKHIQSPEDEHPVQRDDEFPIEPPLRPTKPQVYQPLRPDRPQISQPAQPRDPSPYEPNKPQRDPQQRSEYKPRTQTDDRSYLEQRHIEIQPYQTQNSASISTPTQTIPNIYKPIELPITTESTEKHVKENPPKKDTLSPSSYTVTPFPTPVTESVPNTKPPLGTLSKYTTSI